MYEKLHGDFLQKRRCREGRELIPVKTGSWDFGEVK